MQVFQIAIFLIKTPEDITQPLSLSKIRKLVLLISNRNWCPHWLLKQFFILAQYDSMNKALFKNKLNDKNQSMKYSYFSSHIFLVTSKLTTINIMFLFNRKLYVHVKFAGYEKDLNNSVKILGQQQKNVTS